MIDSMRFEMIVINLISNAIKYSQKNSTVQIKVKIDDLNHSGEAEVEVKVVDNGIGISLQEQELLFQPFFRSGDDDSKKIKAGGHGIGLYNCKMLAEFLGGSISVVSEKNFGSIFTLKLVLKAATSNNNTTSAP